MKNSIRVTFLLLVCGVLLLPSGSDAARSREAFQTVAAGTAIVRRAPQINGRVEGNLQQLTGEDVTLNGGAAITGDLLVPGTPTVQRNGNAQVTVVDGTGSPNPTNYRVTVNGNVQLGRLVRRTDPVTLPTVVAPPLPTGTRDATLNNANDSIGDFATLRNLTLNGNAGTQAIPPGTYGNFTVNGNAGLVLGTAGATTPGTYNLQNLNLNGGAQIQVAGPIVIVMANGLTLNANIGSEINPGWLDLRISNGGLVINGGSAFWGTVTAPIGTVTVNGRIVGNVRCDNLTVNGNGLLRILEINRTPLQIFLNTPVNNQLINFLSVDVSGVASIKNGITLKINQSLVNINGDLTFYASVPVVEGSNLIKIIAQDTTNNRVEINRTVIVDTVKPILQIQSPTSDSIVSSKSIRVSGQVTESFDVEVRVNGINATVEPVSNNVKSFNLDNFPINEGSNILQIIAIDSAGNIESRQIKVIGKDITPPNPPEVFPVIQATRLDFQNFQGKAEPGSQIKISRLSSQVTTFATLENGLFVTAVNLLSGVNNFSVTATDKAGNVSQPTQISILSNPNSPTPPSGRVFQISIGSGNTQFGLTDRELPRPLVAFVSDSQGNPLLGIPVRFSSLMGGGTFVGTGLSSITVQTDAQGYAAARYIPGPTIGVHLIQADCDGNTFTPVTFYLDIQENIESGSNTTVSGVVRDQNLRALPNVLIRLGGKQARTGNDGYFHISNAQAGPRQLLEVIGRDQVPFPGRWPNISQEIDVLPGKDNRMRRPFFLPRVNEGINLPLNNQNQITQETIIELPVKGGEPPIRLVAKLGTRVIFPPDVTDKRFSVTQISPDRTPMGLEDGRFTNLYISVQPSGAVFDPPLEVSFPNIDRLSPNSPVLLMSFDHSAGRFVKVGSGSVGTDGKTIAGNPGSGIRIGAWHAFPPPAPQPSMCILGDTDECAKEVWFEDTPGVPIGLVPPNNPINPLQTSDLEPLVRYIACRRATSTSGMMSAIGEECPKIRFIRQQEDNLEFPNQNSLDDSCFMISKFVTNENLPFTPVDFDGNPINSQTRDFDTFRVQATGTGNTGPYSYRIILEVYRRSSTGKLKTYSQDFAMINRLVNGKTTYRTDKYIRLVSNDTDAAVGGIQTPKVQLQDSIVAKLIKSNGDVVRQLEVPVGRPSCENGLNAVRFAQCRFIPVNSENVASQFDVLSTLRRINEAWAQCCIVFQNVPSGAIQAVNPVSNLISVQNIANSDTEVTSGTLSITIDGRLIPPFQIASPNRRSAFKVAQDIAEGINRIIPNTAFAFNTNEKYSKIAHVVINRGRNADLRFLNKIGASGLIFNIPNLSFNSSAVYSDDHIASLAANFGSQNRDLIDIFIVPSVQLPEVTSKGFTVTPEYYGESTQVGNAVFLSLGAVTTNPTLPFTAAHEIGHTLLRRATGDDRFGHTANQYNLLSTLGTSFSDQVTATKRLNNDQQTNTRSNLNGNLLKKSPQCK